MITNDAVATTLADHLVELGGISAARVLLDPPPHQAKIADLIRVNESSDKGLYERVDGTLVEKALSYEASVVAATILFILKQFLSKQRLGLISGADGFFKLSSTTRGPEVAFVAWNRLESIARWRFSETALSFAGSQSRRRGIESRQYQSGDDFTSPVADFFVDLDFGDAPA